MSSIDSKEIVAEILRNDGTYPGDPRLFAVFSYASEWGNTSYKLCTSQHVLAEALLSPFVHCPKLLWTQAGLTEYGRAFLEAQ
jgi:hypothetical protein